MKQKIIHLLDDITDEDIFTRIYWFINRLLAR